MMLFDLINFAKNLLDPTSCVISTYYTIYSKNNALKQCPQIHQKRHNSLMVTTEPLLDGNQLSLTQLGRNITGNVAPKHNIKRIDRLLGNLHVIKDKFAIYQKIAQYLCGANPTPIILVDWSDVREQLRMMTLRTSISVKGRSITLYERTFLFEANHLEIAMPHAVITLS